jgi:hypothetical protein
MLIRRDGLMAKPLPTGPNFEKLLSSHNAQVTEFMKKQRQAAQSQQSGLGQQPRPELMNPVMGHGPSAHWPPQSQWHARMEGTQRS